MEDPLIKILKQFSIEDAKYVEYNLDRQFLALKENPKPVGLVIANALISYQLTMPGERYWELFAKKVNSFNDLYDFVKKYNPRFLSNKLKRLERFKPYIDIIEQNREHYYENMVALNKFLAKIMNQNIYDKTIVFSIKMFAYAMRALGYKFKPFPFEIAIPLDYRLKKINPDLNYWFYVSKQTNIPPLHIDSLIWPIFRIKNLPKKFALLKEYLSNL